MSAMQHSESLANIWTSNRQSPIRRILFVTYRFNFRWFHNEVLPKLRAAASPAEVLVLATRYDDQTSSGARQDYGDLYSLGEWAQWGLTFRRHYVRDTEFLLHNKFILIERDDRKRARPDRYMLGYGSANLTNSGWLRNLETWYWTTDRGELAACHSFLQFLRERDSGLKVFLQSWLERLPIASAKTLNWLYENKGAARQAAFSKLARSSQNPKTLRIISPYWDRNSTKLLKGLIEEFGSERPSYVELWIDGSGLVARKTDYKIVRDILKEEPSLPTLNVKTVRRAKEPKRFRSSVPLHAKLIEVEGTGGTVARLFGSANFTGAAWNETYNFETIGFQPDVKPFPKLLTNSGFEIQTLSTKHLDGFIKAAIEDEAADTVLERPWINWAVLEEEEGKRIITASFQSKCPLRETGEFCVEASFHSDRLTGQNNMVMTQIMDSYSSSMNWQVNCKEQSLLQLEYTGPPLSLPERLSLRLIFSDERQAVACVELSQPDFETRDKTTGIPLFPDLEGILFGRKPIVSPLPKISVEEALDDSGDEEEELPPSPEADDSLVSIPGFNRIPMIEGIIEKYRAAKGEDLISLRSRIQRLGKSIIDPAQRTAVQALHQALKNK